MVSKLRWTGADLTAAAIDRHFHRNLRAWKSIADVYNSPRKGTVHLPCWINTLVMYYWLLPCGSPMIWEDVNEDCCFLCVLNWKDSGRHTPIRLLEPFGCLCTECPSIHLAWGDHSSQHHSFRFLNLVHIRYCWLLPPSLSSIFLVVELFDLGSPWFEPLAAWQEYARSSMMQSSIFRVFFFFGLFCGVLNWTRAACLST